MRIFRFLPGLLWALIPGLPFIILQAAVLLCPVDKAEIMKSRSPSERIYDRHGVLLRELANPQGERCNFIGLEDVSPRLIAAVLTAEDASFRRHRGINWVSALRALLDNTVHGRTVSGASTITMQLARILYRQPRTPAGKIRQAFDALRLEQFLGKDFILEEYLNRVPSAPGCIGIEAAAFRYLGRSSETLVPAEAALLAGMIQSPGLYDSVREPLKTTLRRNWVLERMKRRGLLTGDEYRSALAEPLPRGIREAPLRAGHFTDYAAARMSAGDIVSTLDWELQEAAENLTAEHARRFRENGLTNAAIVVLDNRNAAIRVMVGSKDWQSDEQGYVNGAVSPRQPGSTLKPFAYALAFDRGWSPASLLADIETEYLSNDRTLYIPRNYSRNFRGPVLAKEALASSLNIPAIRLVRELGLEDFLACLKGLGFSSLDRDASYYGLGLVLGNGEVSLLELAAAYACLARGGVYLPPLIQEPPDYSGQVFQTKIMGESPSGTDSIREGPGGNYAAEDGRRVFSGEAAWLLTSILQDETMRVQTFGSFSPLIFGFPVAVKTGTSGDWRDSWTAGYTRDYTVAVWSGDFEAQPMNQVSGSSGAGVLFANMVRLLQAHEGTLRPPEEPAGIRRVVVCAESGGIPHSFCPRRITVSLRAGGDLPPCGVHSLRGAVQGGPMLLAYNLPPEYDAWLRENGKWIPKENNREDTANGGITISRPREGDIYIIEPGYDTALQSIEFAAESARRPETIRWYLNGEEAASTAWPYRVNWTLRKGVYSLSAHAGSLESRTIHFEVR
ncbi:MAG: penicillin-binding protein 1C [Treponema sp.]|jgi:penicillin-binding protein 1C|nr:penicillin-binding protein 1C [Treponema sp.]